METEKKFAAINRDMLTKAVHCSFSKEKLRILFLIAWMRKY